MFGRKKAPISDDSRKWLDQAISALVADFGIDVVRGQRVVVPSKEYFPDYYDGSDDALETLVSRVSEYMLVDRGRFELQVFTDGDAYLLKKLSAYNEGLQGAAGMYFDPKDGQRLVLALEESTLDDPEGVVATTAHELAHVHLLGDGRVDEDNPDHELLTDLLTVVLGLGVFTANSAFQFRQWEDGGWGGWQTSAAGYLNEAQFGYSLAVLAAIRGGSNPEWAAHLNSNIAHYFKKSARYLRGKPLIWIESPPA